jgi:hypothetical protein
LPEERRERGERKERKREKRINIELNKELMHLCETTQIFSDLVIESNLTPGIQCP